VATETSRVTISYDAQGRRILTHPEAGITRAELVARAKALAPVLRERALHCEDLRQIPADTVRDLTDAGFFRIMSPRRFGGFELGIDALEEVVLELGRGCGSTAWCQAILGGHSWWSALFDEGGQQAIFGDEGHVIMATNLSGNGRATRVEGGFRLSGNFTYLSGCDIANWLCVGGAVQEPDESLTWYYFAIRPEDATIVDNWFMLGMRGTGSKNVDVHDLFVPQHLTMAQAAVQSQEAPGGRLHTSPIYRAPMMAFLYIETTGAAVGVALQAVDVLDEVGRTKHVRARGNAPVAGLTLETPSMRRHLAEAKSLAGGARVMLLHESERLVADMERLTAAGEKMSREAIAEYGLSNARIVSMCVEAVDHCFIAAGTSATVTGHPMERCFRDMHVMSTHRALQIDLATENWATAHYNLPAPLGTRSG
jgi:3-hydroxy-9,10-secoandrosta-1,3,5(10)-triene-9,17-dione monooxygenase